MKYLKKYNYLNESVEFDNDQIIDVFSHLKDLGYTIEVFDFFSDGRNYFKSLNEITEDTIKVKLIKLRNRDSVSSSVNISDYKSMGYGTSGFTFTGVEFSQLKDFYFELLNAISHFENNNPKLCINNVNDILISIEVGKIDDQLIKDRDESAMAYDKLYNLLEKYERNYHFEVVYWSQTKNLGIKFKKISGLENVMASLCHQLKDLPAYSWMKNMEIKDDLDSIKKEINKDGFYIEFEDAGGSGNQYRIYLKRIK